MKRFATAALAVALGVAGGFTGPARAQGVVTDPNVISGCLCSEAAVAALKDQITQAQQVYDEDRAGIDTLDQQIAQARSSVNVAVKGQVEAMKALNLQREQLYAKTYDIDLPALQTAIKAYNDAAGTFGTQCAGRNFDPFMMSQARAVLQCPAVPAPPQ
jgi:TolA-binding protein